MRMVIRGQLVRSAGLSAQLMAKEGKYATLRLPSGEMRMIPLTCRATVGVVGNGDHNLINIGKAGRKRLFQQAFICKRTFFQ